MAFKFLDNLGFEVGVAKNIHNLEDTVQRRAAVPFRTAVEVMAGLPEQVFKPHERPGSLVEWLFIEYPAAVGRRDRLP